MLPTTVLGLVVLAVVLLGCGPARPPDAPSPPESAYPGVLLPSEDLVGPPGLGAAFVLRQRIRTVTEGREVAFGAVLQLHEGRLVVLGLGPGGRRGFVLSLDGDDLTFDSHLPEPLPFPPRFMLIDIQRTFFWGLGPQPDGWAEGERAGERLRERRVEGRVVERTFERLDGRPEGAIRITYEPGLGGAEVPATIVLENGWFGYRLEMATVEHRRLDGAGVGAD
ncbi:MAG: DUF3261 domain-containing protein [Sandaracinaceae bacterium]